MPNIPFEQIKATVLADREARAACDAQAPSFAAVGPPPGTRGSTSSGT